MADNGAPAPVFAAVAALVTALLGLALVRQDSIAPIPKAFLPLAGFYLITLLTTALHNDVGDTVNVIRVAIPLILLSWVAGTLTNTERTKVDRVIVTIGVVQAGFAMSQSLFGWPSFWGWLGTGSATAGINPLLPSGGERAIGSLGHAIPLGLLLSLAILTTLLRKVPSSWWMRISLVAWMTVGLFLSGSRSALIVVVATILLAALTQTSIFKHLLTRILAGCAVAVAFFAVDVFALPIFQTLDGSISLEHRSSAWSVALRLFQQPLPEVILGHGWGGLQGLAAKDVLASSRIVTVDNNLVAILAISGVAGLVLLVCVLLIGFRRADSAGRIQLVFLLGMFFSFDLTLWASASALLVLVVFGGGHPEAKAPYHGAAPEMGVHIPAQATSSARTR